MRRVFSLFQLTLLLRCLDWNLDSNHKRHFFASNDWVHDELYVLNSAEFQKWELWVSLFYHSELYMVLEWTWLQKLDWLLYYNCTHSQPQYPLHSMTTLTSSSPNVKFQKNKKIIAFLNFCNNNWKLIYSWAPKLPYVSELYRC